MVKAGTFNQRKVITVVSILKYQIEIKSNFVIENLKTYFVNISTSAWKYTEIIIFV